MHTDARTLENGSIIEGDVCIVGAGAAGISMAREWINTPYRVILLEGGGLEIDAQMQDLYRGESLGQPYRAPLQFARLHYFGGTTGHWAGWCAPLEPIDFEKRDWVPHSGWPFTRETLDPYYARAHEVLELGPYEYDVASFEDADRRRLPLDEDVVWTKMWQFSPPTRFGTRYRDEIVNAPNVHLYTYARATEVVANEPVRAADELVVKTIDGKEHRVRARVFVLACGSIQNARTLLASNRQAPSGLGNDNDLVGRFFMEHFEMGGAQLVLEDEEWANMYTRSGREPTGELALTPRMMRELQILNGTANFRRGLFPEEMSSMFLRAEERYRQRQESGGGGGGGGWGGQAGATDLRFQQLQSRAEQAPNPDSRVVLSREVDALGMPRADLNWQFTELDKRSMRIFYETVGREIGRAGIGRIQILDWLFDDDHTSWPDFLSGGMHHMGTTRMHDDPNQGVLDADGKVHGIAGLYVAGASMFPTGGAPNPTLTLVALSLRLSDHLKTIVS